MPVETATFINQLNESNPSGGEGIKEGDNHIRLVKAALKRTFPNVTAAITKTAVQINGLLTYGSSSHYDAGSRKIQNVADPGDAQDAATKAWVEALIGDEIDDLSAPVTAAILAAQKALYPIDHIIVTLKSANPATYVGFGTWVRVGEGRVLLGQGTGTDANGATKSYPTAGDADGYYEHFLETTQLPGGVLTGVSVSELASSGVFWDDAGEDVGLLAEDTDSGSQEAVDNTVPAYVVYLWRRTA
jgi:hypothetical protein